MFPVWLGIPKPMIPYPLLSEGAVRTVGSHLGRIPNCSEVPDPPPPREPREPREQPSPVPLPEPPPPSPPPPPPGATGRQLVGGLVGVQDRGVAPPPPWCKHCEVVCERFDVDRVAASFRPVELLTLFNCAAAICSA